MTLPFVPSLAWAEKKHSNFSAAISLSKNKLRLRKVNKQSRNRWSAAGAGYQISQLRKQMAQESSAADVGDSSPASLKIVPKSYEYPLLEDPHAILSPPTEGGETLANRGGFTYFHYGCDGHQDAGWGCGYRTLQTAVSWIHRRRGCDDHVPSIREIQEILVELGDKGPKFQGSRDWIGTLEEFYVIDVLHQVPCKILHATELSSPEILGQIRGYFEKYHGFIAMGGLSDTSSKAITGYHRSAEDRVFLQVVDPHFVGVPSSGQQLIDQGFVRWVPVDEFPASTYNLCLILQP
ncbi:probable Ufm1-specific protease 1 [Drosophila biarmipes]|uniref:probable Ufm1-specific protease 1 n=1 Tax=Drosophila biarmipes TaxID=125945 RepID=UPI0007E6F502|nr:probable Ufm1-specific protease 1 [Drosophila biarmipes]